MAFHVLNGSHATIAGIGQSRCTSKCFSIGIASGLAASHVLFAPCLSVPRAGGLYACRTYAVQIGWHRGSQHRSAHPVCRGGIRVGCLLLVGLLRPVERAWILLPTMIAIAGVLLGFVAGYSTGVVGFERAVLTVLLGAIMIGLGWSGLCFASSQKTRANYGKGP